MTLLRISECTSSVGASTAAITLSFELRRRTRQRLLLDDGREALLLLPRGTVLRGGDGLRAEDGEIITVRAAIEDVSTAYGADPVRLARAAYHLGNRHVAVQVGAGWLRYLHDHVLDHMLAEMGLEVKQEGAPFEPEVGAYHGHG